MSSGNPSVQVRWMLLPHCYQWEDSGSSSLANLAGTDIAPAVEQLLQTLGTLVVAPAEKASTPAAAATWRVLLLVHPNELLPTTALAKMHQALAECGITLAVVSVRGYTLLLVPTPLLGRALAALHQAGIVGGST